MQHSPNAPGHIIEILYLGDLFVFYVDAALNLVKIIKRVQGLPDEPLTFDQINATIKHDLIEQLHRRGLA